MTIPTQRASLGRTGSRTELIAIATAMTALAALAIDVTLPAFPNLRARYGLGVASTQVSWVVTIFLIGVAVGSLFFGTLSDRLGRKPLLLAGLGLYVASGIVAATAPSFAVLLIARFAWGFAAAGPRAVSIAIVRDEFEGDAMVRVMSVMMAAFMFVPVIAPSLGVSLIAIGPWRLVFWLPTVGGAVAAMWVALRLPETLAIENRRSVGPRALAEAGRVILRSRQTVGFTIVMTMLFGILFSFLSGLEIIVSEVFSHKTLFPFVFGGISALMMVANYLNARLIERSGIARLLRSGAVGLLVSTTALMAFVVASPRHPNFAVFCVLLALVLACQNFLFPNANGAAMMPVGHVAGAAASVIAFVSTAGGALIGWLVASSFDGTVRPFALSLFVIGGLAALAVRVTLADSRRTRTPDVEAVRPLTQLADSVRAMR